MIRVLFKERMDIRTVPTKYNDYFSSPYRTRLRVRARAKKSHGEWCEGKAFKATSLRERRPASPGNCSNGDGGGGGGGDSSGGGGGYRLRRTQYSGGDGRGGGVGVKKV